MGSASSLRPSRKPRRSSPQHGKVRLLNECIAPYPPRSCDPPILHACTTSVLCRKSVSCSREHFSGRLHDPVSCMLAAKSDRLKQAKADADKEVAAYKAEREGSYKEKMASVRSSSVHDQTHCLQSLVLCTVGLLSSSVYVKQSPSRELGIAELEQCRRYCQAIGGGVRRAGSADPAECEISQKGGEHSRSTPPEHLHSCLFS